MVVLQIIIVKPILEYLIYEKNYKNTFYYKLGNFDRIIDLDYILKRFTTDNNLTKEDISTMNYYYQYNTEQPDVMRTIKKYFPVELSKKDRRWESVIFDYNDFLNEKLKK